MKVLDLVQGSDEWLSARSGRPTASQFKDFITSTGKKASGFDRAVANYAAERLMGGPAETFVSEWMKRGTELEPQAREYYKFIKGFDVDEVGFCLLDNEKAGASPDGLFEGGGLEIKCPAPHTHVTYLDKGKLPSDYVAQVQGCMWVCERDTWDFLSFHPEMPSLLITVNRDDKFIAALSDLVDELTDQVEAMVESIKARYK